MRYDNLTSVYASVQSESHCLVRRGSHRGAGAGRRMRRSSANRCAGCPQGHAYTNSHRNAYGHTHRRAHCYAHTRADAYSHADANADTNGHRLLLRQRARHSPLTPPRRLSRPPRHRHPRPLRLRRPAVRRSPGFTPFPPENTKTPTPMPPATPTAVPFESFVSMHGGSSHTCGLRVDGSVVCWGGNDHRQAASPPNIRLASLSTSYNHNCGLQENGIAICWGAAGLGGQSYTITTPTSSAHSCRSFHRRAS